MSARSTGHRAAAAEDDDEEKKKRKKQHINESSVAGGSKASQVYDLHPPFASDDEKGLVQLLSMYTIHSHAHSKIEPNQQAKQQTLSTKISPHIYNTFVAQAHVHSIHTYNTREHAHSDTIRKMFQPSV